MNPRRLFEPGPYLSTGTYLSQKPAIPRNYWFATDTHTTGTLSSCKHKGFSHHIFIDLWFFMPSNSYIYQQTFTAKQSGRMCVIKLLHASSHILYMFTWAHLRRQHMQVQLSLAWLGCLPLPWRV